MAQRSEELVDTRRRPDGRVPPHNLQAEESLLGAMLLSRDAIVAAAEVGVAPDDFYKPAHGHIYDAVITLYGAGEPADPVTVADELRRADLLDAIGGPAVLVSLQAGTPATSNAARYARIVEEHALLRRLIGVAGEIAEMGYQLPDDVTKAIDRAESMVFEVAQRRVTDTMAPLRDLLSDSLDRLERLYERGDSITGTPTGFTDLDELTSGLQPSSLIIVGARPGAGKTSFALGVAGHAALDANRPVLFFSLEMSQLELTQRVLAAEARVDSRGLRNGKLKDTDWQKISHAVGRLAEAQLWIDDNPNLTVMEIRAKARRLKSRVGDLGLVVVDYLQLMSGRSSAENRQVEVSEISRGLKILARELECPVIALSQLSRALEMRADKRPMLADLRESGCLTASARVLRADTGAEVTMGELLTSGERDIPVWSLDRDLKMVRSTMTHVFATGVKPVFELRLASGRRVEASANHPFLTVDGWNLLDELAIGSRIAVPRVVPEPDQPGWWPDEEIVLLAHLLGGGCGVERHSVHYTSTDPENLDAVEKASVVFGVTARRVHQEQRWHLCLSTRRHNPIAEWLDGLGLLGTRRDETFIPTGVFGLANEQVALFLRHLWATEGSIQFDPRESQARISYTSSSRRLIDDVQQLLLRFGIRSTIRHGCELHVWGAPDQLTFLTNIGCHGERGCGTDEIVGCLEALGPNANGDTVPVEVWDHVLLRMAAVGVTAHQLAAGLGTTYCGSAVYEYAPSRARLGRVAEILDDDHLRMLAASDVYWDRVVAIEPRGEQPVYDATVLESHNFVANGITVENSLEQDADVVMFIYRDELYDKESPDRGTAEILVAKHRNGPTGQIRLAFLDHYTLFANMAKGF